MDSTLVIFSFNMIYPNIAVNIGYVLEITDTTTIGTFLTAYTMQNIVAVL